MSKVFVSLLLLVFCALACELEELPPTPTPRPATPVPTTAPAQPVPTLGVSLRTIEGLFDDTGYTPFDVFSDTERSAMFFDGGGGAVTVSLYGYPHDLESIGISFSNLNSKVIVTLTLGGLIEELDPDWEDRVLAWVDDNYPSGGRKKTKMSAGPLVVTMDTADTPRGSGWIAELLLESDSR